MNAISPPISFSLNKRHLFFVAWLLLSFFLFAKPSFAQGWRIEITTYPVEQWARVGDTVEATWEASIVGEPVASFVSQGETFYLLSGPHWGENGTSITESTVVVASRPYITTNKNFSVHYKYKGESGRITQNTQSTVGHSAVVHIITGPPPPPPPPPPNPTATPAPVPTATPAPTATPTPKPPVVETTTTAIVAGGVGLGQYYSSVAANPHQVEITASIQAKDGVLEGQDVSFAITSDHAGQSVQPGVAERGEDVPAASVTAKTDASGVARAILTSGSDVGTVSVAVAANGQSSAQSFTIEKAQSEWTATPVDPDSDEKPIVRLSLQFAGLPVNGHPISWKIDRIKLDDNEIVQVGAWNKHARFTGVSATGETISTTGASVNPGEAAAYAYFSDEVKKVDFSGDDGIIVVQELPTDEDTEEISANRDSSANSSDFAVAAARSVSPYQHHEQSIINKVLNSETRELDDQKGWTSRSRAGRGFNTNNVLGQKEERALVTQGYNASQIRIPFGVRNDVSIAFDVDSTLAANGKIASLMISARDTNGDLLQYSRNLETGQARMMVNGQISTGGFDAPGSIRYFFQYFAPALGEAWIEDNYTIKGQIGQSKRVYVTVKNLGIGFYKGGEGLITASIAARNGLIDAAYNPEEAWSDIKVKVDGIQNPAIRKKLIGEVLKGWGNEYDLMYSDAVTGNGEKFAAFAGQGGGQFGFDSFLGFGVGKVATLGKVALKGTPLYIKAARTPTKYVSVAKIAIRATMTNTGRVSRVIKPVVNQMTYAGKISWKYKETSTVFARKALSSSKARIACHIKGRGYVVLVRAEKGILGFNKLNIPCEYARIFGKLDPKTKQFIAQKIELIARFVCFTKGTPILMADGTHKTIEQIKPGDLVMSRDEATGATNAQRVVQTFEKQAAATLVLRLKNGETIETTREHPFYVESQGFTPAGEMGIGTSIVTRAGPSATLASSQMRERAATVYNFEVENTHTYFVGHSDLWVHNLCVFRTRTSMALNSARQQLSRIDDVFAVVRHADLNTGTATNSSSTRFVRMRGLPTDVAGHVISRLLGGPGGVRLGNIFPQSAHWNSGRFAQFEGRIAQRIRDINAVNPANASARIRVTFHYNGTIATRPSEIAYRVEFGDGSKLSMLFPNP